MLLFNDSEPISSSLSLICATKNCLSCFDLFCVLTGRKSEKPETAQKEQQINNTPFFLLCVIAFSHSEVSKGLKIRLYKLVCQVSAYFLNDQSHFKKTKISAVTVNKFKRKNTNKSMKLEQNKSELLRFYFHFYEIVVNRVIFMYY